MVQQRQTLIQPEGQMMQANDWAVLLTAFVTTFTLTIVLQLPQKTDDKSCALTYIAPQECSWNCQKESQIIESECLQDCFGDSDCVALSLKNENTNDIDVENDSQGLGVNHFLSIVNKNNGNFPIEQICDFKGTKISLALER